MLAAVPPPKRALLADLVAALKAVPGLRAIGLGGSHARGTQRPDSDLDLGLYYRDGEPPDLAAVQAVAERFSDAAPAVVTGLHEWGPWVNGGAWIHSTVCKVDFLYRSLEHVERTIEEAERGIWHHDYDQQPPFGFRSVIYLGETACAVPLHDPEGALARLKARVRTYPPALKQRIIADCLWSAEFALAFAGDFARRADVASAAACLARAYHYLVQALYALNEVWFVNDKGATAEIDGFARRPADFSAIAARVLGHPGEDRLALEASVEDFRRLHAAAASLTDGAYRPRWPR
jgi:predicted nucleotidyltransferase